MKKIITATSAIITMGLIASTPAKAITPTELMLAWGGGFTIMILEHELHGKDGPLGKGWPDEPTKVVGTHQGRPVYEHDDDKSFGVVLDHGE